MNVFYEEDGAFRAGAVLADNTTSLQVESSHGKRSKIKASSVLIRFDEPLSTFLEKAQHAAEAIDTDFLWECCSSDEFSFEELGKEYYGHAPSPSENAGILTRLHHSPMYFYKKGKGRYKAAPPDALKAALASAEKKRKLAELQENLAQELISRKLPEALVPHLSDILYDPDKNSVEYKALLLACQETGLTAPHLLEECGAIPSSHDYHLNRFFFEHFPKGLPKTENCEIPPLPVLPLGDAKAFSIDDSATTEIDDAFSVKALENGHYRIGIHIAAPALGIATDSAIDNHALRMLSTVYIPGQKYTMMPEGAIDAFTLAENRPCPVASLYLEVDSEFEIVASRNAVERVEIASNLRHDAMDEQAAFSEELDLLLKFCEKLEAARGKGNNVNQIDYTFRIENDRISIGERRRGEPLDKIVSELMIYANAEWARQLSEKDFPAIYRSQNNGKVRQDIRPGPHQGLGVAQYAWTTSPLRRYVDLVNQRQLVSMIQGEAPAYDREELPVIMRDFDEAYEIYGNFQRTMERYWCLRWLIQENISNIHGTVQRENWVKLDGIPLSCKVPSLPDLSPGAQVMLHIDHVDLLELHISARFAEKV
jgi:exoribonuclease-2